MGAHGHDAHFKRVFGRPEMAADLVRRSLPADVLAALDLDRTQVVTAEYIDRVLRNRRADIVLQIPFRSAARAAFVFLIMEHQSRPDPLMPYRLLVYTVETWTRYVERHRAQHGRLPDRLPPVIPLVVHQGRRPWSTHRTLAEVIDLPADLRATLGRFLPQLELLIDDLAVPDDARTGATRLALTDAALLTMRRVRQVTGDDFIDRWAALLRASAGEPGRLAVVETMAEYLYTQDDRLPRDAFIRAIAATDDPEMERAMATLAQQFKEEGRLQGREEGRLQGREEGRQEGEAEFIKRLIHKKFSTLPPALARRIDQAPPAQHAGWFERVWAAETIAELLDDQTD